MATASLPLPALLFALVLGPALAASGEQIVLDPRYSPGDSYTLSLSTTTRTEASPRGRERRIFEEDVQLDYQANVRVLEVDGEGRPVRERHENVRLTFQRPGESGSLFRPDAAYEVRREGGRIRLLRGEQKLDARVEEAVARMLDAQFEHTLGPELLDPGRAVEVGDSWELDRALSRRFLRELGIRVVGLAGPATARLERDPRGAGLVVHYSIPVAWFELEKMPPNARTSASEARYTGEVRLPADRGTPVIHTTSLALRMNGVVSAPGVVRTSLPWSLRSSRLSGQRTLRVDQAFASQPARLEGLR
jgi:hypothetical protein